MVVADTTNEGWILRQWHKVSPALKRALLAVWLCSLLAWKASRNPDGVMVGLKVSSFELLEILLSEMVPILLVSAVVLAAGFVQRHGARNAGRHFGLFFSRLRHDRAAS